MDRPSAVYQPLVGNSEQAPLSRPDVAVESDSTHQRDRRREKPQLSCTFCRRRKVRCDRQLPCKSCVNKGVALFCSYMPAPQPKAASSVGERIQQLEALVRSLVQQQEHHQTSQTPAPSVPPGGQFADSPTHSPEDTRQSTVPSPLYASLSANNTNNAASPSLSEYGSMRMHSHGANYVSSVHWSAVLNSISELKDHYEQEEEARMQTASNYMLGYGSSPRLLYEPVHATKAEILASIPTRALVDRMVARYFNAQGVAPVILHSGQFLREYESFWQAPTAASFAWIGLLFSIMCVSTQYQNLTQEDPADPNTLTRIHVFRERTVHCLNLGRFTRGGPHVLETMINYSACEVFLWKDANIGLYLLVGMLVQLALSQGYHRDPQKFSNISPFAGEMRRRVWAAIIQIDLRLSSQMGLPRLLKLQQCNTAEPRNLFDSDFDEQTVELPPSRPESEVRPVLYGLAKNRIDIVSGLISDLVDDTQEHPYSEIMALDRKLQEAEASLPPIFQWQPISQSFMVSPHIILFRIWLQLALQRLVIWLHRKYLTPSYDQECYERSRNACVQAAIKILEFQQLVDEETRPDGQLYQVRWMQSSLVQSTFLLGMSVLCYYVQLMKTTTDVLPDQDIRARIYGLLGNTYPMWLRLSTVSSEAREAVEHLSLLLGLRDEQEGTSFAQEATAPLAMPQDAAMSLDQVTWDAYQECIANFPAAFGAHFIAPDVPGSSSAVGVSMTDPLLANTAQLDE